MRMKHPVHGYHNPHPGERELMLANGWTDDVPEPVKVTAAGVIADAAAQIGADSAGDELKALNQVIKRKPGRPPKAK